MFVGQWVVLVGLLLVVSDCCLLVGGCTVCVVCRSLCVVYRAMCVMCRLSVSRIMCCVLLVLRDSWCVVGRLCVLGSL